MSIVSSGQITITDLSDGTITHTAWSYSADGTDRFTTVYPNENLFSNKNYPNNPKVQTPGIWSKVYDTNSEKSLSEKLIGYEGYVYFSFIFKNPEVIVAENLVVQLIAIDSSNNRISQPLVGISKNDLLDNRRVTIPFKLENTKNSARVEWHIRTVSDNIAQNTIIEFEDFKVELGYPTIYTLSATEAKTGDYPSYRGEYSDFLSTASTDPSKYSWSRIRGNNLYTAYANSTDGTDGFTTVYPNLNLLTDSKDFKNKNVAESAATTSITSPGATILKEGNDTYLNFIKSTQNQDWFRAYMIRGSSVSPDFPNVDVKPNSQYTFSVLLKGTGTHQIIAYNNWTKPNPTVLTVDLTDTWTKYVLTIETETTIPTQGAQFFIRSGTTGSEINLKYPKVEQGSTATPYMQSASEVTTADWPKYRGEYSDISGEQSTNPSDYTWSAIRGDDGLAGKDGVGIKSTQIMYAQSTSVTTPPTTGWTAQVPTLIKGQYLWTQTTWVYTDNTGEAGYTVSYISKDGNNGTDGVAGKDGVGISNTTITYASHTNGTTAPTTGFTTAVPSVPAGQFLWTKTVWTYTDNSSETGYSVARMGNNGATGPQGPQGTNGTNGTNGQDAISVTLSNENVTLPANAQGGVTSYTNSGTTLSVFVGKTAWSYGTGDNKWTVAWSASGATRGAISNDGTVASFDNISGMSATNGATATQTFVISVNVGGTVTTFTKVQNISKSEKGITGDDGVDSYTYFRYSPYSDGKDMTSLDNADSKYMGICVTTSATAPSSYSSYKWSKYAGNDANKYGDNVIFNPKWDNIPYGTLKSNDANLLNGGWNVGGGTVEVLAPESDSPSEKIIKLSGLDNSLVSKGIPVMPGERYIMSYDIKTSDYANMGSVVISQIGGYPSTNDASIPTRNGRTTNAYVSINGTVANPNGLYIDTTNSAAITNNNWNTRSQIIEVKSDTAYLRPVLYCNTSSGSNKFRKVELRKIQQGSVTISSTEPSYKYVGMQWKYSGTSAITIGGIAIQPSTIYIWSGTVWQLYVMRSTNLQVDNAFITNAMIGDATIDNAKIKDTLSANKIDPSSGNMLINSDFSTSIDGWEQAGTITDPWYLSSGFYTKDGVRYREAGINAVGGEWTASTWRRFRQTIPVLAGQPYSASLLGRVVNNVDGIGINFEWCNASGSIISSVTSTVLKSSTRTLIKLENAVAPTGATQIRFTIFARGKTNAYVTQVMLNAGTNVAPWTAATNNLTVLGNMIVNGSIDAVKLNADKISSISADLGDVTAGTAKLMASSKITSSVSKNFGIYLSKDGILSSGPTLATSSTFSTSNMGVANLSNGELRFIKTGFTEDLAATQNAGMSASDNAFIRFEKLDADTLGNLTISSNGRVNLLSVIDGQSHNYLLGKEGLEIFPNSSNTGNYLNSSIELIGMQTYIDFHYGMTNNDYSMRIINDTATSLSIMQNNGSYGQLKASAFTVSSSKEFKRNIREIEDNQLDKLMSFNFKKYRRYDGSFQMGLILDDVMTEQVTDSSKTGIDLYSLTSVIGKAVQELSLKIKAIEEKNDI
jgi:hypothetical protein